MWFEEREGLIESCSASSRSEASRASHSNLLCSSLASTDGGDCELRL